MHITLINKTARELAREYFEGRLSFDDYRDKRRRLVDQVTEVEADAEADAEADVETDVEVEAEAKLPPVVEETVPVCDVPDRATGQDTVCETKRFPLPVILLLMAGGLGAAGWLLFSGDDEAVTEPPSRVAQLPVPKPVAQKPVEVGQGVQLISDFVQGEDWGHTALVNFVIAWSALDSADQEHARSVSGFQTLVEGLREQILEQRALGDTADAGGREAVLMSFAEHLGALPLLADLQQTEIDTGNDRPDEAQHAGSPPVVDDTEPASAITEQPVVAVTREQQQLQPPAQKAPPPPDVATPAPVATLPAAKPAAEPAQVEPAPAEPAAIEPAATEPAATEPAPAPRAPVQVAAVPVSGADPCPASLARTRRPVCRDTLPDGEPGPVLVVLPAGGFQMGSKREGNEQPLHRVEIARPFATSAYEISRSDYQRFCRASGTECPAGHWSGENDPMTNVNWGDARAYVEWLSRVTGAVYRLPSEAEWEYAARAGTTTEYPFSEGDKILPSDARFDADSPLAVNDRSVNANRFRLRHIMGNVREWVADVWQENYRDAPGDGSARLQPDTGKRVVRGGSYADTASRLRSAARSGLPADKRDRMTGFRVVREIHN